MHSLKILQVRRRLQSYRLFLGMGFCQSCTEWSSLCPVFLPFELQRRRQQIVSGAGFSVPALWRAALKSEVQTWAWLTCRFLWYCWMKDQDRFHPHCMCPSFHRSCQINGSQQMGPYEEKEHHGMKISTRFPSVLLYNWGRDTWEGKSVT